MTSRDAARAATFAAGLAATALSVPAKAEPVGESATSNALVVTHLSLVKDEDLDFGYIIPGGTQGFVTIRPDGTLVTSGGIVATAGETSPAAFYGYGSFNQRLRINIDATQYNLRRQGGTQTMRLDQLTISSQPPVVLGPAPRLFVISSPNGFFRFTIGGRLRVAANQRAGLYTGEIDVTVEYM